MNFTYVESSDLKSIAINENNLVIQFHTGGIYEYVGASCEYYNLLKISSKGKYFPKYIKDNILQ